MSEHTAEGDTLHAPAGHLVLPLDVMSGCVAHSPGGHRATPPLITSNRMTEEIGGRQALPSPNMFNRATEESLDSSRWPFVDPLCQVRTAPGTRSLHYPLSLA